MKIITIMGNRPQFIKASVVSKAIAEFNEKHLYCPIVEIIVHTGQHFDSNLSDIFFAEMDIPQPRYNLDVHGLSHGAMTGLMISRIEEVMLHEKPDCAIVYGDTNSTLAGALAAKKTNIKVIHIEAGLRSFNMCMPEEINRVVTDRISDLLFCPSDAAMENLAREGYGNLPCKIVKSGDVMLDAALLYSELSPGKSAVLEKLGIMGKDYVLVTVHRQENTDDSGKLKSILCALERIGKDVPVIFPVHPRTRLKMQGYIIPHNLVLVDPVGYMDMIELIKNCKLVMTDSGGLQKEAYYFNKHCIIIRKETEWEELLEAGYSVLTGSESDAIYEAYRMLFGLDTDFKKGLYGEGNAGTIIVNAIAELG